MIMARLQVSDEIHRDHPGHAGEQRQSCPEMGPGLPPKKPVGLHGSDRRFHGGSPLRQALEGAAGFSDTADEPVTVLLGNAMPLVP